MISPVQFIRSSFTDIASPLRGVPNICAPFVPRPRLCVIPRFQSIAIRSPRRRSMPDTRANRRHEHDPSSDTAMRGARSPASLPLPQRPHPDDAIDDSRSGTDVEVGHVVSDEPASRRTTPHDYPTIDTPVSPLRRRRSPRNSTFRTLDDFEAFPIRPGWRPGAEPGLDPAKPDGGHASMSALSVQCDITVVDFCQDDLAIQHLDNDTLGPFLKLPQPSWSTCRWINVNGLSWDVTQALGKYKNLHGLALEDLMNTRNRTKADWYVEAMLLTAA